VARRFDASATRDLNFFESRLLDFTFPRPTSPSRSLAAQGKIPPCAAAEFRWRLRDITVAGLRAAGVVVRTILGRARGMVLAPVPSSIDTRIAMTADHKKPGVAFWTTVVVVVMLVVYPLSLGPVCWITCQMERGEGLVAVIYRPILWTVSDNPAQLSRRWVFWYAALFSEPHWGWYRYTDPKVPGGMGPWQWGQLPRY
jgi:hypothetical protein